ncbi:DNA binding domain-containing protein, excisionase family [Propionispira arboris]|uniref:DNA binding domain-containing protein, excisionase family n=1 Tax=Propionispira arboris TaxID=84035 RepID=A0A1H7A4Q3_9FIRM|nr:helix-turn-helix domain-containing protein [Propionispira arboris]SEJ60561.1 DNA binding domain-containing protein, excisionase family [Propionispira arboris]
MKIMLGKIRAENNLTQQEVADMIGISLRMYQRLECAESNGSIKIREKISDLFKISSDKLFLKVKDIRKDESSMITTNKKLYDVDEFCTQVLNNKISKSTIYAKIKTGEIKAIKIGRKPLIPAWFVEELLTSHNI